MAVIVHLTSVHDRYDTRIFLKECRSLARLGHTVTFLVADGKGHEVRDGVSFESVRKTPGRLVRMLLAPCRLLPKALALKAQVYHLHDPELIPLGLLLKLRGAKVVFDAHEDLPKQLMDKPYLAQPLRRPLAAMTALFLRCTLCWMDGLVAATPSIREALLKINAGCVAINNYPILGELDSEPRAQRPERAVCYIGGLSRIRGLIELVQALDHLPADVRLKVAGAFEDAALEKDLKALPGWRHVDHLGTLGRAEMSRMMATCAGGIVTFLPAQNHLEAQPNKMFEYMSAGLPVIGSNFPLWQAILGDGPCGLCVDPRNPQAIAEAIMHLLDHPDLASAMGAQGQRTIKERFNWEVEARKLRAFYDSLFSQEAKA